MVNEYLAQNDSMSLLIMMAVVSVLMIGFSPIVSMVLFWLDERKRTSTQGGMNRNVEHIGTRIRPKDQVKETPKKAA